MTKQQVSNLIVKHGILPLFYHADADVSVAVCRTLYDAGIRAIEYTNRGENALENFKILLQDRDATMPDMFLGIGTIKSNIDAERFLKAGADFIISPGVIPSVGAMVQKANKLWIPGCMTTTEIIIAEQLGASLVKLFPGNVIGPEFVSSIKDIFPKMFFMPTGGVNTSKENLERWFDAGVCAVGIGSKLISRELLEQKQYDLIARDAKKVLALIQSFK